MFEMKQMPSSEKFTAAWLSAAKHLQNIGGDSIRWLRNNINPPLAEHLSFFVGNHLIFVFVGVEGLPGPSSRSSFLQAAQDANAIPAIIPIEHNGNEYEPTLNGWGLLHAETRRILDPSALDHNEQIEMSDWEIHDFALQVIENFLHENGNEIISKQSYLHIDPSIWFRDDNGESYVIVRSGRYPLQRASKPDSIYKIIQSCKQKSLFGYFASVTVADHEQQFTDNIIPLFRGTGMIVRFTGLEPLYDA